MHVLPALFSYVKANEAVGLPLTAVPTRDWTAAQYEEIQFLAMSALCTLAPLMVYDYMGCHGGTRLLLMLEWCISKGMTVSCVSCLRGRQTGACFQELTVDRSSVNYSPDFAICLLCINVLFDSILLMIIVIGNFHMKWGNI